MNVFTTISEMTNIYDYDEYCALTLQKDMQPLPKRMFYAFLGEMLIAKEKFPNENTMQSLAELTAYLDDTVYVQPDPQTTEARSCCGGGKVV